MLLCPAVSLAQSIDYYDLLVHNNRTVVSDGSNVPVDRANTVVFEVNVTGTAEVLFRISGPGRFAWQSLSCTPSDSSTPVTSTSTNGLFTCNVAGGEAVSARLNTCTSCTASVSIRRSTAILGNGGAGGGGGSTGWPTTRVGNITFANSFVNNVGIGDGTDYWALYRDPTSGLQFNCVVLGVENACNYIRKLAAGFYFEIQNASGTSIFRVTNDTGAITNATIDATLASNTLTLNDERHFPVATCQNATASANYDIPTTNAPTATCDTGTNTQKGYLAFNDTTDQSFQDHWVLPTGFVSVDVHFRWKAAATTGAAGWCAQLIRVADGSTSDPAFPAQAAGNCVSDTAKGTTLQENTATISGVTCTSCVAGDHVYVRISRDADGGAVTDSMTGDGLLLTYGRTIKVAH